MDKRDREKKAKAHFDYVADAYGEYINQSIKGSVIHRELLNSSLDNSANSPIDISVIDSTSENAISLLGDGCCVLNFASFTRPGGGFIKGSIAQEEALCHASTLYNVLKEFTDVYNENYKGRMHDGLYEDWSIWSPGICFIYGEGKPFETFIKADVITCAAPNASAYFEKTGTDGNCAKYKKAMYSRIKHLLDVADMHNEKKLVLGAFGCGVFGNNPAFVAETFKDILYNGKYGFDTVVFAIPSGRDGNYEKFKYVFG